MDSASVVSAIGRTTGTIFLAEFGDKTMISTAILAIRTRRFVATLLLSTSAFTVANTMTVIVAWVLRLVINEFVINVTAAMLFIAVGVWMLVENGEKPKEFRKGMVPYFLAIMLAEIGDKTQLAMFTVALATGYPHYALIGGIAGYTMANAIGVLVAKIIGEKVPWRRVKALASAVMICIGLWLLIETLLSE